MRPILAAVTAAFFVTAPVAGKAADRPFPDIAETVKAAPETVDLFNAFFTAKSRHDVEATMSFFSPSLLTYTDAILGWSFNDFASLRDVFASYMPKWGDGRSYPFRIIGGPDSAVVAFVDTPELFGGEIRLMGAVDFKESKIIRWVDYWDSTGFPSSVYDSVRTPAEKFPTDFKEEGIARNAAPEIAAVASDIQKSFSAMDAKAATEHFSPDVMYEDFALRAQVLGKASVARYLERVLEDAPFGKGAVLIHIVGGVRGGGFEWQSLDGKIRGLTALELDEKGQVSRITTTYDGRLIPSDEHAMLVSLSAEP